MFHTNRAFEELGHEVEEIWEEQLGKRWITHGNLHSLLEQPRKYRDACRLAYEKKTFDITIAQQPQSYLAAKDHKDHGRAGLFFTMSQGVENRIGPLLDAWRKELNIPGPGMGRHLVSSALQKLLRRQWPMAVLYSDGVLVQHTEDERYIKSLPGQSDKPVHVCASGLTEEFLQYPSTTMCEERRNRLLFVGQISFYKGINFLAKIVNLLLEHHENLSFTWVCQQEEHAAARNLFNSNLYGRIHMQDWVAQKELVQIYDSHGIFIFPTIAEGFAKAPLEAMSRGMCVIASRCCGMVDYIFDGETGVLRSVGDVGGFVTSAEGFLNSADYMRRVSAAARKASSRYTWRQSAKGLVEFSESLRC